MELKTKLLPEGDRLERLLLICWYVTIASAPFGSYLLRIQLPVLGHFFLFRGAVLVTCLVYLICLIRRRENPFTGLSRVEWAFVAFAACLLLYGAASALRAVSFSAWFSKFFILCQMLALVFLFLKLCASPEVMKNTMLLMAASTLVCALGCLLETIRGPFFPDTLYSGHVYLFFNKGFYHPIFTFVNPNDACGYLFFSLVILFLYTTGQWDRWSEKKRRKTLWRLAAAGVLLFFLSCVCQGRLIILSLVLFLAGLFVWLAMRYRRGLSIFLLFAAFTVFVYVGENYAQVKYGVETRIEQIQSLFNREPGGQTKPGDQEPEPDKTPPPRNEHAALYTIAPAITGKSASETITESDGLRQTMLKNGMAMLLESKGLGIGLGNAELRVAEFQNTGGLTAMHCYLMELFAECGVFAIVPLLALVFFIFKSWWGVFYPAFKRRDAAPCADILFMLFTAAAFLLASTASASSRGMTAMWLYLAFIVLSSGRLERDSLAERADAL